MLESRRDRAGPPKPAAAMPSHLAIANRVAWRLRGPLVFDEHIRRHVERRWQHERLVEARRVRPERERPCIVGRLGLAQAQVPLAHAGGVVARAFDERGQRHAIWLDQRRRIAVEHARLEPRAPRVAPGQQAVARGRANGRRGVRVGESHALAGQAIDAWRRVFRLGVVAPRIAIAHVVSQDDNDIGPAGFFGGARRAMWKNRQ